MNCSCQYLNPYNNKLKVIRLLVVLSEDLNHLSSIRAKNINNKTSIKSQIWKGVPQAIKPVKEEKAKI